MTNPTISVTRPGPGAKGRQRYPAVELRLDGLTARLRYAPVAGRLELVEASLEQPDAENLEPITPRLLGRYDRTARAALAGLGADPGAARPRVRRELTDEFLRDVLRRHLEHERAGLAPTETLATEEGVGTSSVRHWLRTARERALN